MAKNTRQSNKFFLDQGKGENFMYRLLGQPNITNLQIQLLRSISQTKKDNVNIYHHRVNFVRKIVRFYQYIYIL